MSPYEYDDLTEAEAAEDHWNQIQVVAELEDRTW